MTRKILCVFFSLICFLAADAQKPGDSAYVHTDLVRAMEMPASVYHLKLKRKKYRTVPSEVFSSFPNLETLDLSYNYLTELPSGIRSLTRLKKLVLNNNELLGLPPQIGELKSLEYLDLWSNELTYFPEEMIGLKDNLKVLDLRGILIDDEVQKRIRNMLPKTKIHFSPGCNCGK